MSVTAGAVQAEVRVNGSVTAVRVDATKSNIAEVLSTLESTFRLRVKTSMVLDRAVAGTFTGSLAQVLARLLEGHNYFIRRQASEIQVTVVGMPRERTIVVEQARVPMVAVALEQPRARAPLGGAIPLSQAVRQKAR